MCVDSSFKQGDVLNVVITLALNLTAAVGGLYVPWQDRHALASALESDLANSLWNASLPDTFQPIGCTALESSGSSGGSSIVATLEIEPGLDRFVPGRRRLQELSGLRVQALLRAQAAGSATGFLLQGAVTSHVTGAADISAVTMPASDCGDGTYRTDCSKTLDLPANPVSDSADPTLAIVLGALGGALLLTAAAVFAYRRCRKRSATRVKLVKQAAYAPDIASIGARGRLSSCLPAAH
jgi:hypothetical protein